ncbi:MAG: thiopurine S-methyltransferase [Deltaproteobacteria bacterium]|nr:thiopurine S-methyltransferase [Deltaproteobacteria bacterium]
MDLKFWLDKWERNDLGFHANEFEPILTKYFAEIHPGTVFVPLCGKSRDLLWFIQKGWRVLGVEASPIACRAFFDENGLSSRMETRGDFTLYIGDSVTLWCGDFFSMPSEPFKDVTAVYDRAALIALPADLRPKYVERLIRLLSASDFKRLPLLLIALEYPQDRASGPPFSVDSSEVRRLYGPWRSVQELLREEDTVLPRVNAKFHDVRIFETAYLVD